MLTRDAFWDAWATLTGQPPNAAQRDVTEYIGGPLWVIAGPGCGKTYALILRCLYLLCVCDVPPSALVLTTFMNRTAQELQHRLHEALLRLSGRYPGIRTIDVTQMRISTLHSLCWQLLTEAPGSQFRHLRPLSALERAFFLYNRSSFCQYEVSSTTEHMILQLLSWIDQKSYTKLPPRWLRVKKFVDMYERILNDRVDRTRFAAASPVFAGFIHFLEEYEEALQTHRFTDQTLLQQQAFDLLSAPEGRTFLSGIAHVIVDEYQDTNPLQAAIYRALAAAPPHQVCVVGDDDQSLFRFRGGTVGCMVRFAEECQAQWPGCEVKRVALRETYRSHPAIVQWINEYITIHPQMALPNARVHEKAHLLPQLPNEPTTPVIWAIRGKTKHEVATNFANVLCALKNHEVIESYGQCALLAHSFKAQSAAWLYTNELTTRGIPLTSTTPAKDHPVYQQILGTLLLTLDRSQNLMPATFAVNNAPLARYVETCRQAAQTNPILATMARQIATWLTTDPGAGRRMSLTALAQRILNAEPCIVSIQEDPVAELAARSLMQTLDAYDRVVEHGRGIFLEEAQGKWRIKPGWMAQVYRVLLEGVMQEHLERGEESKNLSSPEAVSVLTIHKAKGLEFPVVAVVVDEENSAHATATHRLEHDVFPFRQDLPEQANLPPELLLGGDGDARALQDSVRLHYVGYSRAQSLLLLLILDKQLQTEPPALGLGTDAEWFQQHVEVWPPKAKKTSKQQKKASGGVEQHDLWG